MMPDLSAPDILRREISITPEEFRRALALAFPAGVEVDGDLLRVGDDAATLEIALSVGAPRIIAALRLPTLYAQLRFTAGTAEARQRLLARMDRAMQRGGG